jgi:3'-phosphoadenosine 5'-phosphosulfate sulfotransferase (PAPS reductase)/FAD synthetase
MKTYYVISLSGGLGSFGAAKLINDATQDYEMVFCDTKTEDEDLYRFLGDMEHIFKKKIIRLVDGRNIWEVFRDVRFHGNSRIDPCSRVLKREPFKEYMKGKDSTLVVGIGPGESRRMISIKRNWAPTKVIAPLIEANTQKEQVLDWLDAYGIKPPRLYDMGFPHNNCGGFCVKTGQKQMALLLKTLPERYAYHEQEQEKTFTHIGQARGFIRKWIGGELKYLSLKEFRLSLQSGDQPEMFDESGCGCFSDEEANDHP